MSAQFRAAILAVRPWRSIFATKKSSIPRRLFDRRDRGVAENKFGWFVGHGAASL
jgi:hypothetical protein